jgi:acyl dehydratase
MDLLPGAAGQFQPGVLSIGSIEALKALLGKGVHVSEWIVIDQRIVDRFADITDDAQWIHVDPERAAHSPFGGTIAHGMLSLSLFPGLFRRVFAFPNRRMALNYGFDKVRFINPVRTGSRVRGSFSLEAVQDIRPNAVRCTFRVALDIEGLDRPAFAAIWLVQMAYDDGSEAADPRYSATSSPS